MRLRTWFSLCKQAALGAAICLLTQGMAPPVEAQAAAPKILFVSNRDGKTKFNIFTMNPDGSGQANLTKSDATEFDPVWSPDGKQIAFVASTNLKDSKADVYVMNADGTQRKPLTQLKTVALAPAWSPDGKKIAFCTMDLKNIANPGFSVQIMDVDGKNLKAVGEGMTPMWSQDGKQILFTRMAKTEKGGPEPGIYTMDADGSRLKALITSKAMMAQWSPDDKQILYMGDDGTNQPDIFVMKADGSGKTQLTKTPDLELAPTWSPDGKRILFTRMIQTNSPKPQIMLYSMDADGKNSKSLTTGENIDAFGGTGFFLLFLVQAIAAP